MQQSTKTDFDIVVIGGGMVGLSLASAFGHTGLSVAVIEASQVDAQLQPSFDARTVALAYGSKQIFDSLGLWDAIESCGVTPIKRIHVSDRGHVGSTHLDSHEESVPALGYVVETSILGKVLREHVNQLNNITQFCPATLTTLKSVTSRTQLGIHHNGKHLELTAKLVVAADGGNSQVRKLTGIKTLKMDYGQHAVIANVAMDQSHNNIAYERFTDTGPMALLPSRDETGCDDRYALVWTIRETERESIMELNDKAFLQRLQQRFGIRAGQFVKTGQRHVYPLGWTQSREFVRSRLAIIGNAAHTLHPVAGQGFNLGLRDVAVLAQVINDGVAKGQDPGDSQLLNDYANWRRRDQWQTAIMTDGIVRLFSTGFTPLALARNIGLTLFDIAPPLKHTLAKHAMGFVGKLPRLARGLRL